MKRTFAGKKRAWWPKNTELPKVKWTDAKEWKGHHTHPKTGDGHHQPVWYGHHPQGSLPTHVHPYGETQAHRP
jgi:hypothetical protein